MKRERSGILKWRKVLITIKLNTAVRRMIATMAGVGGYESFINYLRTAKKPVSMSVAQLSQRAETLFSYATMLSQEDNTPGPEFTELEKRQFLLGFFPQDWIDAFRKASAKMTTTAMAEIIDYMNDMHECSKLCDNGLWNVLAQLEMRILLLLFPRRMVKSVESALSRR